MIIFVNISQLFYADFARELMFLPKIFKHQINHRIILLPYRLIKSLNNSRLESCKVKIRIYSNKWDMMTQTKNIYALCLPSTLVFIKIPMPHYHFLTTVTN